MSGSPFIYDADIPPVILPEIKRALEPWGWMVPGWCERVFVGYTDDPETVAEGSTAVCYAEYPYRWARLTFRPTFLSQTDPVSDGLHEVIHISVAALSDWTRDTLKRLVSKDENPVFRQVLLDELRDRIEMVVEDIARRVSEHNRI